MFVKLECIFVPDTFSNSKLLWKRGELRVFLKTMAKPTTLRLMGMRERLNVVYVHKGENTFRGREKREWEWIPFEYSSNELQLLPAIVFRNAFAFFAFRLSQHKQHHTQHIESRCWFYWLVRLNSFIREDFISYKIVYILVKCRKRINIICEILSVFVVNVCFRHTKNGIGKNVCDEGLLL